MSDIPQPPSPQGPSAADAALAADTVVDDPRSPNVRPPATRQSAWEWARANLFSSIGNTIITLVTLAVILYVAIAVGSWFFTRDYEIVKKYLRLFMVGQFPDPDEEMWRFRNAVLIASFGVGFFGGSLAKNSYVLAQESELGVTSHLFKGLLGRFWILIALFAFFCAFTDTWGPKLLLVASIVLFLIGRSAGWFAPDAVRHQAPYISALIGLLAIMTIAGTSLLGGFCVGAVIFLWVRKALVSVANDRGVALHGWSAAVAQWIVPLIAGIGVAAAISQIGFEGYGWANWGGLFVSIFTASVGIALGLPLGIVLALGRRSSLPVIKSASILFIEFIRGVPLISLLLFSTTFLPLFLPPDWEKPADLTLAIIVIMFFSAAYIAEIVRGGLQAVAKGQTEAGDALGLSRRVVQQSIVLPQALRAVIPALVGQFISLFKDTSLLLTIGIVEFLSVSTIANTEYVGRGLAPITLTFCAIGYWAINFTMSRESRRLEQRLGVGVR